MAKVLDEPRQIQLPVEGMTCAACASRIARALSKLDGVTDAEVNLATAQATVRFDPTITDRSAFTERIERLGYHVPDVVDFEGEEQTLRRRALIGVALAVPAMAIHMLATDHGDTTIRWILAALATPVVLWIGWPYHRKAIAGARNLTLGMDALVSLGAGSAWLWSMAVVVLGLHEDVHFGTAAIIVALITVGKWLEARAKGRARTAIEALADLGAPTAELEDGTVVASADLAVGQRFVVRTGARIATDGVVVDGSATIDTSMLTGEPVPVLVAAGDSVAGATVNTSGWVVVEATKVGADTTLAQIGRLVARAQASQAPIQRLADRVSGIFVPIVIVIALVTFAGWILTGHDPAEALVHTVAVLVIACPCALGLATPMAIMVGTGRGAQLGVLIRGGEVLEAANDIDTVVLDKTGTITEGRMSLSGEAWVPVAEERQSARRAVASIEARSDHPVARALAALTDERAEVDDFHEIAGHGVGGRVGPDEFVIARPDDFASLVPTLANWIESAEATGQTVVVVGRVGPDASSEPIGALAVADRIKPNSAEAVQALQSLGLTTVLLTGDNRRTAEAVARAVGIDTVIAGVLPDGKDAAISELQAGGARVAMVGDGINDAPALARADLGIAMGTGTAVAREAADLTLVSGDLLAAVDAVRLSRRTFATIKGNLFWAFAYNVAAIPLAVTGRLGPAVASGAMAFSSLFVASNSLRLRRFRSSRSPSTQGAPT